MMKCLLLPTAALLLLLPTACQQQQKPTDTKANATKKTPPPQYLGSVFQVYPDKGLALLRIIGPVPEEGETLITHPTNGSTERIGNLSVNASRNARSGIVAATVRSGTVVGGDRVYRYREIAQPEAKDQQVPEEQTAPAKPEVIASLLPDAPADTPSFLPPSNNAPVSNPFGLKDKPEESESTSSAPIPPANTEPPKYIQDIPDTISDM